MNTDSKQVELHTPAKVNLFLELHSKRPDGFHELETVIAPVSRFDTIRMQPRFDGRIRLKVRQNTTPGGIAPEPIPEDESNLVTRALELVRQRCGIDPDSTTPHRANGADVLLVKRIPSAAGLGGASGNAAGALLAANRIWQLGLSEQRLTSLAGELGSDVPVFLSGGTAMCTGRGEQVRPIRGRREMALVIAKPAIGLSTAEVYSSCKIPSCPVGAGDFVNSLRSGNLNRVAKQMFNRLEQFAGQLTGWIERMRWEFEKTGCPGHQMTGSGSAYFGVFPGFRFARRAARCLSARLRDVTIFTCRTL